MSDIQPVDPRKFMPLSMLSLHVLLSVGERPAHGYAIGQEVERRSGGALNPTTGALYQALKRLRDDGLLARADEETEQATDNRRRYFRLTELGRKVVALEAKRLDQLVGEARAKNLYPTSS